MVIHSNHWLGKYLTNCKMIRLLVFLDRRLTMSHVYVVKARFFSNQPRLVARFTQRHRNQIGIYNYHKPWFFKRREYDL